MCVTAEEQTRKHPFVWPDLINLIPAHFKIEKKTFLQTVLLNVFLVLSDSDIIKAFIKKKSKEKKGTGSAQEKTLISRLIVIIIDWKVIYPY